MSEFGDLMYMFCCCCCCSATKSKTPIVLPKQLPPKHPSRMSMSDSPKLSLWLVMLTSASPCPPSHFYSLQSVFPFSSSFWSNPIIGKQRNVVGLGLLNLFSITMKRTHKSLWNILFKNFWFFKQIWNCPHVIKDKRLKVHTVRSCS